MSNLPNRARKLAVYLTHDPQNELLKLVTRVYIEKMFQVLCHNLFLPTVGYSSTDTEFCPKMSFYP